MKKLLLVIAGLFFFGGMAHANDVVQVVSVKAGVLSDSGNSYLVCTSTFANVAASQTDSVLVAAVTSTSIRVVAATAVAGATATNLTFNSKGSGSGTAISPLYANGANGGVVMNRNDLGWFTTNSGEGLTVTTGAGSTTGILVKYCLF